MPRVPVYEDQSTIQPTPVNPQAAATLGGEIVDLSEGLSALGGKIKEMNSKRQTMEAEIALAGVDEQNWKLAATDPDLDTIQERVKKNSDAGIQSAAKLIKDTQARNIFVQNATLDTARKNVQLEHHIFSRQSEAFKMALVDSNDALVEQWKNSADPSERALIKKKSYEQTIEAAQRGFVHGPAAKAHLDTLWHKAAIDQVKDDAAVDPEHTLEQLQKGKDGLYKDITESERKNLFNTVKKQLEKQGQENNHVMAIAQNATEQGMLDKMHDGTLTMDDVTRGRLGINGVPARPEFAKAAETALTDPFPTEPKDSQYMRAWEMVIDPERDPAKVKVDVLKMSGLTPREKAQLLTVGHREMDDGKKRSIDQLIQDGIQKNKQEIMQRNQDYQLQMKAKQKALQGIHRLFRSTADDQKTDEETAGLTKKFLEELSQNRVKLEDLQSVAHSVIVKNNVLKRADLSGLPKEGKLFKDGMGRTARVYPDGHIEVIK